MCSRSSSSTDLSCVCTNTAFQTAAQVCLATCPQADQQAADALQKAQCATGMFPSTKFISISPLIMSTTASGALSTAASASSAASSAGASISSEVAGASSSVAAGVSSAALSVSSAAASAQSSLAAGASSKASSVAASASSAAASTAPTGAAMGLSAIGSVWQVAVAAVGAVAGGALIL
jgi:hypothetical protein